MKNSKVILFGGNGFVGTNIAQRLVEQGASPVCVSRTGIKPAQLTGAELANEWANKVEWIKGDASQPDVDLLDQADAVIALVGSPPLPTFSKAGYQQQLTANSVPNLGAINAALQSGVTRLVVLGANLPELINTDKFAYAKGKRLCFEATQNFASKSNAHTATVLQPSAIYGVRYTATGKPLNIGLFMKPVAQLQGLMPKFLKRVLPKQLVSVEAVAQAAVVACFDQSYEGKFTVVSNQQIIDMASG